MTSWSHRKWVSKPTPSPGLLTTLRRMDICIELYDFESVGISISYLDLLKILWSWQSRGVIVSIRNVLNDFCKATQSGWEEMLRTYLLTTGHRISHSCTVPGLLQHAVSMLHGIWGRVALLSILYHLPKKEDVFSPWVLSASEPFLQCGCWCALKFAYT